MLNSFEKYYFLWNKKTDYTVEEIEFLKLFIKKKKYTVSYGFYNKVSSQKKQIAVVFDLEPMKIKKGGVENNWEIIHKRPITAKEIEEFINQYFQASFKRFLVFYYNNVDRLIYDDKRLDAETPEKFIDECRRRGYSGTYQLKLDYSVF